MGTFGYLMPWCLMEDEAAALKSGWKPYQMQRGYSIDDSTLTAASSINLGNDLVPATSDGERIKDMMAWNAVEKSQMAVASGMQVCRACGKCRLKRASRLRNHACRRNDILSGRRAMACRF